MNKFAYLVAASALAVSAFGQGQINLNNRGLALVNDAAGKPLTGTSFVAQVWYGSSASTIDKSFAPSPFRVSTTTSPGSWNPVGTGGPGTLATLEGFAPGSTVTLQVAVWDSSIAGVGAAQALAKAPGTGLSETFTYAIPTDPLAIPGGMEGLKSFNLVASGGTPVVPEPTTIALGALGAAALLWRRRK
jgi:hypothetical protein